MDRRSFIRTGIGAIGGLVFPWGGVPFNTAGSVEPKSKVWLAIGEPGQAADALAEAIGGLKSFIPPDGIVLIKPNIAFPAPPNWGATTDPDFLSAVIDLCIDAGARRVIVIDHPVGTSAERNLARSGIGEACEQKPQVKVLIADDPSFFRPCEITKGKVLKTTHIAKILDKVDLFINLPTAKHHSGTGVSLGLKNLMGLIWDRVPLHEEMDLNQAIGDLSTVIRPQLTFLEARYALLTNGPTGPGQIAEVGKYLAGFDPVAVDAIGVELARWGGRIQTGRDIPHLAKAYEQEVGEIDRNKIDLIEVS